jgi:hypothetical protein
MLIVEGCIVACHWGIDSTLSITNIGGQIKRETMVFNQCRMPNVGSIRSMSFAGGTLSPGMVLLRQMVRNFGDCKGIIKDLQLWLFLSHANSSSLDSVLHVAITLVSSMLVRKFLPLIFGQLNRICHLLSLERTISQSTFHSMNLAL